MSSTGSVSDNEEFDPTKAPAGEDDEAGDTAEPVLDDDDLNEEGGDDLFGDGGDDGEEEPA